MFCKDEASIQEVFSFAKRQATELLKSCKNGIDITVTKHVHKRSTAQNSYYFLMCQEVANFLSEAGMTYGEYEIPYTGDLLHELNKKLFGVKTTTKLSKEEFCDYMTKMIQFWQERTNWEWTPSELPDSYLAKMGYTSDYTRGYL